MWSLCSTVLLSCALAARGQAVVSGALAEPASFREGCEAVGGAQVCITGNVTGNTLNVQCRGENYPLGSAVNIYLFFFPFTSQSNIYTNPLHGGCYFNAFEAAEYTCSFTTDLSLFAKGTSFECSFNHKYPPKPFFTKTYDSPPPAVRTVSKAWRPKALLSCTDEIYQPKLAWGVESNPSVKGVAPNVTLFTPGTELRAFCLLACNNMSASNELTWKLDKRVLKKISINDSKVVNFTLEYEMEKKEDGKLLECILSEQNAAASEPIAKLTTTLTNGENYTIAIDDLTLHQTTMISSPKRIILPSVQPHIGHETDNTAVTTKPQQFAGQVREGCENIGIAQVCIKGNVTGTTLQVECTEEHYPLGSNVNIYMSFYPPTEQRNNYTEPLYKGCYFREWEVVKYTCSFTTDISLFNQGTSFECSFDHKSSHHNHKASFYTKLDASSPSVTPKKSLARRPEALLNCKDRMGRPALIWSVDTQPGSQGAAGNITFFAPNTLLNVFCVLACHNYPIPSETWELVWKLDDHVLSDQSIMDMRVENFTLKYNLSSEDNGKVLECSLRKQELNSVSTLVKITTTLTIDKLRISPLDSSKSSAISLKKRESSTWAVAGPILVLLVVAAVAGVVFWRRRARGRGMWTPRFLGVSNPLIASEGSEAAAEFVEVRPQWEHANLNDESL